MNLRKFFNYPDENQKSILATDLDKVMNKCGDIAYTEHVEQRKLKNRSDGSCPKCRKINIVDKIRDVQGKGNISGSFSLGFGDVSGSMYISSESVNHCNDCGHEWKKFNEKIVTKEKIVVLALDYLAEILKDPANKQYSWKMETIKVFDNCYAETIFNLSMKHKSNIRMDTASQLNRNRLRLYYKSVFDTEEKELKKF